MGRGTKKTRNKYNTNNELGSIVSGYNHNNSTFVRKGSFNPFKSDYNDQIEKETDQSNIYSNTGTNVRKISVSMGSNEDETPADYAPQFLEYNKKSVRDRF